MSKKLLALTLVFALVLACVPTFAAGSVIAQATYRIDNEVTDSLNAGRLAVSLQLFNMGGGSQRFVAAVAYYDSESRLLDFTAKTVEFSAMMYTVSMGMDIPGTVENDYYVRTILMDGVTLAPIAVTNEKIIHKSPVTGVETGYTGKFERYYTLDSESGSIAMNGSAVTVASAGTTFRLKDMGEGYVGFADSGAPKRRLAGSEGAVSRRLYGFGGTSMLWKLEDAGDGKYYIAHYDGGYMAIEDGAAVISDTPCAFTLTLAGETPFTLVTSLEGYELMTEAEKQRLIEICTSAGAGVFPSGTNSDTMLEVWEKAFTDIYENRDSTTAEEQMEAILEALQSKISYNSGQTNEINAVNITDLPGGGATITKSAVKRETLYIWDTGTKEYNRIDVTYTGFGHSQTVKFYYDETGETNVQTAIEALARFPYEYRQFIEQVNVYVPSSSFTYNCDGHILTVRVTNGSGIETMARNFAHELGHSIEFLANGAAYEKAETHWCNSAEWQQALTDDILPVSQYGSSNSDEGLAEFARLYFQCYGSRDRMIGLKQLYPNRYASFVKLLKAIGMETLY